MRTSTRAHRLLVHSVIYLILILPMGVGAQPRWQPYPFGQPYLYEQPYLYDPFRGPLLTLPQAPVSTGSEVAYSVTFYTDSSVTVFDSQGRPVPPRDPRSVSELPMKRIQSMDPVLSSITVEGSHYKVVKISDQLYVIPLAH